jgi:diguanylate cyclase (GGDEF)-like protein/PAS domain S-box-containing protein
MDAYGDIRTGGTAALVRAVVDVSPVPMLVVDLDGRLIGANRPWEALTGMASADCSPGSWLTTLDAATRDRLAEEVARARAGRRTVPVELQMVLPGGRRWTRWWIQQKSIGGTPVLAVVVIDVDDDLAQKADLQAQATHDDLTGLVNRRFFLESTEQALRRAERFGEAACLVYIDLDGFKRVNDEGGHGIGDLVLGAVGARLDQAVRGADLVGRIGGDEFAVLLERLETPDHAEFVIRRVAEALNGSVEVAGRSWPIAASMGTALSRPGDTAADLLQRADEAMYAVKRGRPAPAVTGAAPAPPAGPRSASGRPRMIDLRPLQEGMDTIRRSLEGLLGDLEAEAE